MKSWSTIDKSGWPRGEWDEEPDKIQWVDKATNLDCLMVRVHTHGSLCGYVGIPESHPLFGMHYDEADEKVGFNVHGGLTFADECHPQGDPSKGVCHTGDDIANKTVWWLGFDCAHGGDFSPAYDWRFSHTSDSCYRNVFYVKEQVENLARQLNDCH